ncbi:MAG: hypothetical protein WAL59_31235 [Roseiarcus sp.]
MDFDIAFSLKVGFRATARPGFGGYGGRIVARRRFGQAEGEPVAALIQMTVEMMTFSNAL